MDGGGCFNGDGDLLMADVYVQQRYKTRDPWPPTDEFVVMADGQEEARFDSLVRACEFSAALSARLDGLDGQQEFKLDGFGTEE